MTTEKTLFLEDLPVGTVLTSASRTISAQDIADFCDLSGDHNPLHKDDEWVRANTPFEQRIAHGLLVLGVSSGTPCPEMDSLLIVAYLSESRNFKAPTYPGESIVTEWKEFRSADLELIGKKLKSPLVFDGRNLYDPKRVRAQALEYFAIGR